MTKKELIYDFLLPIALILIAVGILLYIFQPWKREKVSLQPVVSQTPAGLSPWKPQIATSFTTTTLLSTYQPQVTQTIQQAPVCFQFADKKLICQ